jgi:hypothetical protein
MKMKILGLLTLGAALTMVQAQAGIDTDYMSGANLLGNAGFDAPVWTGKIANGFASVPDWNAAPTPTAADSGIDIGTAVNNDGADAYSRGGDADVGVWANQLTTYQLVSGDSLYLSLIVGQVNAFNTPGWYPPAQGALHYRIWLGQYGPTAGAIYNGNFQVGAGVNDQTYYYKSAVIPNSVLEPWLNSYVGISIWNSSDTEGTTGTAGPGSWISFDDVYLGTDDIISPTPEPGTLALLTLGGLSALVAIRRRR